MSVRKDFADGAPTICTPLERTPDGRTRTPSGLADAERPRRDLFGSTESESYYLQSTPTNGLIIFAITFRAP